MHEHFISQNLPNGPTIAVNVLCTGNTFYQDSFAIPGTKWGTQHSLALRVNKFDWIAAETYTPSQNPTHTGKQGLIGWSPSGELAAMFVSVQTESVKAC
jgi:hypothetical protein